MQLNTKNAIYMVQKETKENQRRSNSSTWTFQQHRFSCHHQQCKQGSTKLIMKAESMWSKRPVVRFTVASFFQYLHGQKLNQYFFLFQISLSPGFPKFLFLLQFPTPRYGNKVSKLNKSNKSEVGENKTPV